MFLENASQARANRSPFRTNRLKIIGWCWLFMIPTLFFYILFQAWPIVASANFSFLDWSGLTASTKNVGLGNYKELLGDRLFWNAFLNSFKYTALIVPLELAFSLLIAYTLNNERLKVRSVYRTMFFAPVVTASSIMGIIMIFIWGTRGPLNSLLRFLHIINSPINFLGDGKHAMFTVILISIWKDGGIYMIYWLAGLQSVPRDVYEAATIDGAGKTRTFFSIVLPLILPIGGVIATLCIINSLKVFDLIKTMTEGGPFYATDVVATYVYRMAFSSELGLPRLGYASAAALLFGLIVILIGVVLNSLKSGIQAHRDLPISGGGLS